ncbi:hypothetical protein Tco_0886435 [Tanacetum coccineum]
MSISQQLPLANAMVIEYNILRLTNSLATSSMLPDVPKHVKRGRDTKIPQSSGPPVKVGDEAVHKELGDRMERAATTASSLEAEQDSGSGPRCQDTILGDVDAQTRFETTSKQSNDPPLSRGYTLGSGEDKTSIRSDLHLEDAGGTDCLPTTTSFEELARMGYEKPSQKLTFYKAFFSPQWKYLIHTITQCLSAKSTAWNEFSSTMASLIICLATNQRFNLSKYIFDAMVKQLDGGVKFLMYPQFLQVLDLEKAKDAQVKEIADLKKRVQRLERKKKSRTTDASKQGRRIKDIDKDADVSLVDDTQGRSDDANMFDINDLHGDEVNVDMPEINLAQTLIQIKAAKPKVVTTAATTTTTTRPKARGVVVQEPIPLKRKDQVALDEDLARNIQAQLEAEIIEEEKLARKHEEEANIALIESWDNTQAMMEADIELAQRLQTEEQGEITIKERSRLFVKLMNKRKKHFAMLRAKEKTRKPPTKAQKRNQISTYLKNIGGYKHNQLKSKSYEEIQKMFNNEMRRVNTYIPMDSEKAESSKEKAKGSRKKILDDDKETDEHEEVKEDDEVELKKYLVIVKDDEIAIDAIQLATKLPVIVEYKILKVGIMVRYQLIRADGSSKRHSSMIRMLQDIDRENLENLWKLVKTKHGDTRPKDEHERVLLGDFKAMFEQDIKSEVWRNL